MNIDKNSLPCTSLLTFLLLKVSPKNILMVRMSSFWLDVSSDKYYDGDLFLKTDTWVLVVPVP